MTDPVTVFMLVVAGLLVVGTVGEQVFARTGVPSVIWLVALGVLVRVADIVPAHVIVLLGPFVAALVLVIILFDAGTNLTGGTGEAGLAPTTRKRAQRLAFIGFAVTVMVVALFSHGLAALGILKAWTWTHAFMLGSVVACGASEVALPSLKGLVGVEEAVAVLRRESAITKALAVTGTVLCLDLVSPAVGEGEAALAMAAGFGFALAFGSVAGMLWVVALQRLAGALPDGSDPDARNYGFTLAVMVVLYVLSEAAGGSGPLSVLVFGAVLGNAGGISRMFGRATGEAGALATDPAVQAALGGHARTIEFVRTLVFAMVGLTLAPPMGPVVMGVVLAFLVLVVRLAVARFAFAGADHRERNIIGACAPRGMATIALVTLALAHRVPGVDEMVTLVFSAVTTSVLLFTLGLRGVRGQAWPPDVVTPVVARAPVSLAAQVAAEVSASHGRTVTPVRMVTPMSPVTPVSSVTGSSSASYPGVPAEQSSPSGAELVAGTSGTGPAAGTSGAGLTAGTSGSELARGPGPEASRRSGPVPTVQSMQAELSPRPGADVPVRHSRPMAAARSGGSDRISGPMAAARGSGPLAAARGSGPLAAARSLIVEPSARAAEPSLRIAVAPVRVAEPEVAATDAHAPTLPRELSGPQVAASNPAAARAREPQVAGGGGFVRDADSPRLPEPEGYLPTLLQIEGAEPAKGSDDPLAGAMARALAKRPIEVTQARRRPTGDYQVPPPTFMPFSGSTKEDAMSLLAGLGMRDDGHDTIPPKKP